MVPHIFVKLYLRKWANFSPSFAWGPVVHCYPPFTHLSPAAPQLSSNRLSPAHLPPRALTAIIIMPFINNASQYINNASVEHEGGVEGDGGERGGATDGLFLAHHMITVFFAPLVRPVLNTHEKIPDALAAVQGDMLL